MKRIYYLFLFLSAGLFSCKKFLDTKPSDFVTPDAYYTTADQLQTGLNGVYDILGNSNMYGRLAAYDIVATTDESCPRQTGVPNIARYIYDAGSTEISGFWQYLYFGIERANLVLASINKPDMDSTKRNVIKGETLFLRSYFYFLLAENFGDVPLILQPTSSITNVNIARTPVKQVYEQVIADMTAAETLLKTQTATSLGYGGKVTKTAVEGMLARVCITMAGYPLKDATKYNDALQWASKVVSSGEHALNSDYKQIFINLAQDKYDVKESMWEVEFYGNATGVYNETGQALGNLIGILCSDLNTGSSAGWTLISRKLFDAYVLDPASTTTPKASLDTRRDWNCANYSWGTGTTAVKTAITEPWLMYAGKFRREYETVTPKNKNFNGMNFPVLRYADVLLMQAEAENQVNGPTTVAYNAINMVRRRAYGKPVNTPDVTADLASGLSKDQFQAAIRDERMREFCFEGLRKMDLIRWGNFYNDMQDFAIYANANGASGKATYAISAAQTVAPRNVLLPIPTHEMSLNNMLVQNPGW
ncbi:MAG: RagB/SusD family nutrient uptake outer membrane protein [Chitinophagaceae bacterium]